MMKLAFLKKRVNNVRNWHAMSLHEQSVKALERIKTTRNAPSDSPVSLPQFDSNKKKDGRGAESYNSKSETG
jgi:hypothetical protein